MELQNLEKAVCNFCDTDFVGVDGQNGGNYSLEQLIKKTLEIWRQGDQPKKFIILTGGEPLLQVDEKLINELKKKTFILLWKQMVP